MEESGLIQKVPTIRELKKATLNFKRFYNGKAVLKTDDYAQSIDLILTGNVNLNLPKDLTYLSVMSKGEPFFD